MSMNPFIKVINKLIKSSHVKKCNKCNYTCNAIHFQQNFENWTSGNNNIDEFIQHTQLMAHKNSEISNALEWIPYDRMDDIVKNKFGNVYKANWINGNIKHWDDKNQNWKREGHNRLVNLKRVNSLKNIKIEFENEINIPFGITQDPETKNYMMVLNNKCKKCNRNVCNTINFQHKFIDWTSGNNDIDILIQETQLSAHDNADINEALEWIPYDRLDDIVKNKFGNVYKANWINGNIKHWDDKNQNWKREGHNRLVNLKRVNSLKNIKIEFENEINIPFGITQDPETKNYMMVLNNKCKKCYSRMCDTIHFQYKFIDWTSGNNDIDKLIQDTQLSAHNNIKKALEWIPYDRLYNIKYIAEDEFGKVYRANWIDGSINNWDSKNQNWKREDYNMFVNLKNLNNSKNVTIEFTNKIKIKYEFYGITQDPETNNYMMVLNKKCKKCDSICNTINFQHKFIDWTSEWIPYDRLDDIAKNKFGNVYKANWIDGNISYWDDNNQNWKRDHNRLVNLKRVNNLKNITIEFENEINIPFGITQDPETDNYMIVLNYDCKKCDSICNTIHFQHKFIDWTSGYNDIDKFIQDTQSSSHNDLKDALEWIPYDRLYNIKYIAEDEFGKVYRANWIDGYITNWDSKNQNWKRENYNMFVNLKNLNNSKNVTIEFTNKIKIEYKFYGITQYPETKNYYLMILNNKCKKCNSICNTINFQHKFIDWTSGNNYIDKFIQDTQLSAHDNTGKALEWIPNNRLYDIKYIAKDKFGKVYRANWIDGYISEWDYKKQNWKREGHNMIVNLKSLNTTLTLKFTNKIKIKYEFYGITQDLETKNWTSGNDDIDKFIQDTQLSSHKDVKEVLEWIPYDRFYNIEYIAKGGFGKVYRANWIDGYMTNWNNEHQNRKRYNENMLVALKSLDNSKNVTLEFINEIMLHNKVKMDNDIIVRFYGITQDPKTKNYIMVLEYAEDGNLRNYLDKEHNMLNWNKMFEYLQYIIVGLKCIHEKEFIHRDLHIGNILKFKYKTAITDMGLCKPANYNEFNELEGTKNKIYGVLPYIAPEILRGQNYTKAADIYSFGIIMYEVISGLPPYHDLKHDNNLAIKICKGLRPRFNIKVPQLIVHLIKRCLDANPLSRPIAKEIINILFRWQYESNNEQTIELRAQIKEADEISNNSSNSSITSTSLGISYNTHSEAIYTSRLLDFNNLPEPKNSDDYYEQNDNIISEKFSESLQLDISQLNNNKMPKIKNSDEQYDNIISKESSGIIINNNFVILKMQIS
ncbi:kinase-like domain-containing protein [Rhizophagus irregularis DAOM 181602=DAOM 197198]|nr:kinase-like domain-containing protein [Rhizophagus irregularis DAOM 181602=DAOM 197198]